jgi:Glycosyl hydrolase 108
MRENFNLAAEFTLLEEVGPGHQDDGALHTDPADPGGTTRWGISQRAYPKIDLNTLDKKGAMDIYLSIWMLAGCDALPYPMDVIVFDTAFNMGQSAARSILKTYNGKPIDYLFGRLVVYKNIAKKHGHLEYLYDWMTRVIHLYFKVMG